MICGNTLFAWQVLEDGNWGVIASGVIEADGARMIPLVARDPKVAGAMKPMAQAHADSSGLPVRLARFEFDMEMERL